MKLADPAVATDPIQPATATAATFTKWMVGDGPEMAGVTGGAVGEGTYQGRVLDYQPGDTQLIDARYHFEGSLKSFTALVHVEQTGIQATIAGVVTDGWGKGKPVRGSYSEIRCEHDGVTSNCWRGTLEVISEGEG